MLNLNLETAKFIKNDDGTYTIYQPIGTNGVLKLPRVSIEMKAEALVDDKTGDFWQYIEYTRSKERDNKTCILLSKIKRLFRKRTDK